MADTEQHECHEDESKQLRRRPTDLPENKTPTMPSFTNDVFNKHEGPHATNSQRNRSKSKGAYAQRMDELDKESNNLRQTLRELHPDEYHVGDKQLLAEIRFRQQAEKKAEKEKARAENAEAKAREEKLRADNAEEKAQEEKARADAAEQKFGKVETMYRLLHGALEPRVALPKSSSSASGPSSNVSDSYASAAEEQLDSSEQDEIVKDEEEANAGQAGVVQDEKEEHPVPDRVVDPSSAINPAVVPKRTRRGKRAGRSVREKAARMAAQMNAQ